MKVLVTGGAGYVGSHFCKWIAQKGWIPVVVDNLITGHREAVQWGPFYQEDILNSGEIKKILSLEKPDCVVHFAALSIVGESVKFPEKYYENNITGSMKLLKSMQDCSINKFIFSSSCAVYGNQQDGNLSENHILSPINPYGYSKLVIENYMRLLGNQNLMSSIGLRYFNAAGADPEAQIGENHHPETHLIPLVIRAAFDSGYELLIFGNDYVTPDGTCIRDYVHVNDLAEAHYLAVKRILNGSRPTEFFNLGSGTGYSIFEIINAVESTSGRKVKYKLSERRIGDPARLVAKAEKAYQELGWKTENQGLNKIIRDAINWYLKSRQTF